MTSTITGESSSYPGELRFSKLIPSSNRRSVLSFCIANFFWWIGLYFYVPVLPVYIQSSGARLDIVGLVLAAYAIPQVLLRIPIGLWADKLFRRKPLVVTGMIFTSLGALGLGISTDPWLLFLARMTVGIGAATWVVFPIYFAAYYQVEDSGRAIGLINFIRGGALIAATAGGGFVAESLGFHQTFFGAAIAGMLALFALLFAKEQPLTHSRATSWRSLLSVAARPLLIAVSGIGIMLHFAVFAGVFGFVPIYATKIGASSSALGLITMINLGFSTLGALLAVWVWERLSYRVAVAGGALLTGVSLLAIPFIPDVVVLMAVQTSFGFGCGVLMTTLMALSIRDASREHQATAMGVFQAVYAVGMLTGPLFSGFLGAVSGLSAVFFLSAALCILIAILAFLPVFSKPSTG